MNEKSKLTNLRTELDIINLEFLELIEKRQEVVNHIQELKGRSTNWSPVREKELFLLYAQVNGPSYELDLMYSLLIEKQASQIGTYPRWSLGQHLESIDNNIYSFINPILLFIRNREEYQKLKIKIEYKNTIEETFKNEG